MFEVFLKNFKKVLDKSEFICYTKVRKQERRKQK